uniref:Phosphatidylinositol N-acetylglucosaminyltransferase subunit H conserved domain-containing protein n=1 Tax=Quercus lobata TaxID=97700 RepID=A0A7N2KTB1_QUELO
MTKIQLANLQYLYKRDDWEGPHPLDTHHIVIQWNSARIFLVHLFALLLFINAIYLCLLNGTLGTIFLLSMLSSACLVKSYYGTLIEKESVVIIPSLGVQLKAHYWSGRVVRSFIPIDKILKPVLNENVTPFTCYWSLVLLVCGKKELILAFKVVKPPVKLLVPSGRHCVVLLIVEKPQIPAEDK